jgi:hypothetical protein
MNKLNVGPGSYNHENEKAKKGLGFIMGREERMKKKEKNYPGPNTYNPLLRP